MRIMSIKVLLTFMQEKDAFFRVIKLKKPTSLEALCITKQKQIKKDTVILSFLQFSHLYLLL